MSGYSLSVDLGDLPTWIGSLATVAALTAAIAATRGARRLYDIEVGRDRVAAERDASRYAERVSGWVAVRILHGRVVGRGVVLSNASGVMVFDVRIGATTSTGSTLRDIELAAVPPGVFFIERRDDEAYAWAFPDAVDAIDGDLRPVMKKREWRVTHMEFRDTANRRWVRSGDGELEPAGP